MPLPLVGHYSQSTPQPSKAFMKPILDVFLEKFLDFYGLGMPSAWQPMYWIHVGRPYQLWRLGATARTGSPLLCDTFAAISTTYFGLSIGD